MVLVAVGYLSWVRVCREGWKEQEIIWLHFFSYFIRLISTYQWMQCTKTDLKSPLRKNMVFFSSLITVVQWISLPFTYSDKKSLTNGKFSISWNRSSECILPGYGLPWVPVHSLHWRGAGPALPAGLALSPFFFLTASAPRTTMVWELKSELTFCGSVPPKSQWGGSSFVKVLWIYCP